MIRRTYEELAIILMLDNIFISKFCVYLFIHLQNALFAALLTKCCHSATSILEVEIDKHEIIKLLHACKVIVTYIDVQMRAR